MGKIQSTAGIFAVLASLAFGTSSIYANSVTFSGTKPNGPDGGALSANAVFTVSANTIQIVLTNTTPTTVSAAELLTGLSFTLNSGKTVTAETQALAADVINLSGTVGSPTVTHLPQDDNLLSFNPAEWQLTNPNTLTWNGSSGPDFGIIGPAPYTSANKSIVGNGPHNPYVNQSITFTLTGSTILATDTIQSATFYFGTGFTAEFTSTTGTGTQTAVPLPAAVWSGFGLLSMLGIGGKLRKKFAH